MKKQTFWQIGIRRLNDSTRFWDTTDSAFFLLDLPKRYWAADPFPFSCNNEDYIFYELFDTIKNKGYIAYSKIDKRGISKPKIVIKQKYHMSFPYIFTNKDNEICIIPETSGNKTIELYKATSFPDKWKKSILLSNINACDSILVDFDNEHRLFSSIISSNNPCHVENIAFQIDEKYNVQKKGISCNIGDTGIRNGGKVFYYNNNLIRVGQDCSGNKYGKGIIFWKINKLNPYNEEFLFSITPDDIKNHVNTKNHIEGIHTYNSNEKYETIDILTKKALPFYLVALNFCYKCYGYIFRRIIKIFQRRKHGSNTV